MEPLEKARFFTPVQNDGQGIFVIATQLQKRARAGIQENQILLDARCSLPSTLIGGLPSTVIGGEHDRTGGHGSLLRSAAFQALGLGLRLSRCNHPRHPSVIPECFYRESRKILNFIVGTTPHYEVLMDEARSLARLKRCSHPAVLRSRTNEKVII